MVDLIQFSCSKINELTAPVKTVIHSINTNGRKWTDIEQALLTASSIGALNNPVFYALDMRGIIAVWTNYNHIAQKMRSLLPHKM